MISLRSHCSVLSARVAQCLRHDCDWRVAPKLFSALTVFCDVDIFSQIAERIIHFRFFNAGNIKSFNCAPNIRRASRNAAPHNLQRAFFGLKTHERRSLCKASRSSVGDLTLRARAPYLPSGQCSACTRSGPRTAGGLPRGARAHLAHRTDRRSSSPLYRRPPKHTNHLLLQSTVRRILTSSVNIFLFGAIFFEAFRF